MSWIGKFGNSREDRKEQYKLMSHTKLAALYEIAWNSVKEDEVVPGIWTGS